MLRESVTSCVLKPFGDSWAEMRGAEGALKLDVLCVYQHIALSCNKHFDRHLPSLYVDYKCTKLCGHNVLMVG